ncbi:hypothetical protein [Streptomyces sp. NPDC021224]|uniref:hypothetical protein n=1 Tax=unclassified Streptomyces TaxID=2593676 RepID=UPI00378BB84E
MTTTPPRRRTARRLAVPLTAAALALGVATATAAPAAASNSYNGHLSIEGSGTPGDDLDDEGAVNTTTNTVSTVTCFWQNILHVDNYPPITGIGPARGCSLSPGADLMREREYPPPAVDGPPFAALTSSCGRAVPARKGAPCGVERSSLD